MYVRRRILVLAVAGSVVAIAPAAQAQTTRCRGNHYSAIDRSAFPGIGNEYAVNLPRLTSGYAPRCLVADSRDRSASRK